MATLNRRTKNTYGIRTRRLPSGELRYNAVITVHDPVSGQSKKKELSRRRTEAEAESDGMEAATDRKRGVVPWGPNTTLSEFLDTWHDQITPGRHEATTRRVRKTHITLIKKHLGKWLLKGQGPRSLNHVKVQAFLNALGRETLGGKPRFGSQYITNVSVTLRMALRDAVTFGYAERNVAEGIRPPKNKQGREFPVILMPDTDDWKIFTAACMSDIDAGIQDGAIFLLEGWQGLRPGEVGGLRSEDVEPERGVLHIRHQLQRDENKVLSLRAPKWNSARDIKLLPLVADALKAHAVWQMRTRSDVHSRWQELIPHLVFTTHGVQGSGGPLAPDNLGYMWRQFMARHPELPRGLRLHSGLRGSCATRLHWIGMPDGELMKWMGHKDIKTTYGSYVQITKGSMSTWADADAEFAAAIE